jgi:hypothetical protein
MSTIFDNENNDQRLIQKVFELLRTAVASLLNGVPVDSANPTIGDFLRFDGAQWRHVPVISDDIPGFQGVDVDSNAPDDGDILQFNAISGSAGEWLHVAPADIVIGTASAVVVANEAADTSCYVSFFNSTTGNLAIKTNTGLTFNSSTGILTATGFVGPLTGAVAGNASSATYAAAVTTANEASDTTCFIGFTTAASGNLPLKTNTGLTFNSSTGMLTATGFTGPLTGNASTVTTNANLTGPITSVGNATSVASQTGTGTTFVMSASPTLTGTPLAPTAAVNTNSTQLATTAFVNAQTLNTMKGHIINSIYNTVTPDNVVALWVFDQTGAVSTITDHNDIGGGTAHTVTLRNGSLSVINASTCSPGIAGCVPYLNFDATHLFNTPDAVDLSFPDSSFGSSFSIIVLQNNTDITTAGTILAKDNRTTASPQREWNFTFGSSKLIFLCWDNSTAGYIGRTYNTALTDTGTWNVYGVTKSDGITSAAIKLYRNGVQIDDTDYVSGTFNTMVNTTALVGDYYLNTAGSPVVPGISKKAVVLIVAEELTVTQMRQLSALLQSYAGTFL